MYCVDDNNTNVDNIVPTHGDVFDETLLLMEQNIKNLKLRIYIYIYYKHVMLAFFADGIYQKITLIIIS